MWYPENIVGTAEGIEDPAAIAPLLSIGCDLGQGYHFAKPLDSEEIERILADAPEFLRGLRAGGSRIHLSFPLDTIKVSRPTYAYLGRA